MYPHKKTSNLRSNKITKADKKQFFYPFNTVSVSKSQTISPSFHSLFPKYSVQMAQSVHIGEPPRSIPQVSHSRMVQPHGARMLYFSRDPETAVSPHYSVSVTMTKKLYQVAGS
jgi:hypothetical protein